MTVNWNAYWRLMRFDKPIGILLLMWPTWWALVLAGAGHPSVKNSLIFTADRDFDPHVERTRLRPLASGELRLAQAISTFFVLMTLAFLLVLLTNALTIKLAFIGAALASTYPFFKRFTHLPQVVLGIAFGWGIPMAFAAESGAVPWPAWWLLGINTVWSVIYDTLYAMVDREDDLAAGIKSTAILFGRFVIMLFGFIIFKNSPISMLLGIAATPLASLGLGNPPGLTLCVFGMMLLLITKRLVAERTIPPGEWKRVMIYRLFLDRDTRNREAWIYRASSGTEES